MKMRMAKVCPPSALYQIPEFFIFTFLKKSSEKVLQLVLVDLFIFMLGNNT